MWAFWSLYSLTSRVCPVKSLPQNSHLARRWGHVYLRWSSIRTRGICAPHLLVQGTASCLHVLRWACQKKPIFSVTTLGQCHGSLARGGIIQWLLSGNLCSLTSSLKKRKNHLTAVFYSQHAVTLLACWLSSVSYLILLIEPYLMGEFVKSQSLVNVSCICVSTVYCFMPECCLIPNICTVSIMCVSSCLSKQKAKLLHCRQRSMELYFSCKVCNQDMVWPQCAYALLLFTWQTN